MIRSVEMKGFRGIREGRLDDLAPLTILVGPNGSGKSTVLQAILIGANPDPRQGVTDVCRSIKLRAQGARGLRWVLWRAGQDGDCKLRVRTYGGSDRACDLTVEAQGSRVGCEPSPTTETAALPGGKKARRLSAYGGGPSFETLEDVREIRFVEPQLVEKRSPLDELYTRVVEQGRREEANRLITQVVGGARNIEILTDRGQPIVHLVFGDHSVPAALAGDGILMVLRLVVELASRPGGVVLLEEPEVHQHPGAIRLSAKAMLAAVRRDVQVVLSTHSLELIDALVAECAEEDLDRMAVFRLALQDGVLKSSRLAGPDVKFARTQIEDDLR